MAHPPPSAGVLVDGRGLFAATTVVLAGYGRLLWVASARGSLAGVAWGLFFHLALLAFFGWATSRLRRRIPLLVLYPLLFAAFFFFVLERGQWNWIGMLKGRAVVLFLANPLPMTAALPAWLRTSPATAYLVFGVLYWVWAGLAVDFLARRIRFKHPEHWNVP
jgi:hypothetical protein